VKNFRVPDTRCVNCNKLLDGAAAIAGSRGPRPGDVTVCLDCRHLMVYGDDLQLRNPTDDEIVEMAGTPELILGMKMLEHFDKWKEHKNAVQTVIDNRASRRARKSR
jgi:hypothetical protein